MLLTLLDCRVHSSVTPVASADEANTPSPAKSTTLVKRTPRTILGAAIDRPNRPTGVRTPAADPDHSLTFLPNSPQGATLIFSLSPYEVLGSMFGLSEPRLLERESELRALGAVFEEVLAGGGRSIVLEGAAGTGKSALTAAAGRHADSAGLRVLRARGGELECEFAFGAIRQLFEPVLAVATQVKRERLSRMPPPRPRGFSPPTRKPSANARRPASPS